MPNRVGSSLVNIRSSIGRTGSEPGRSQACGSPPVRPALRPCRRTGRSAGSRRCASRSRPEPAPGASPSQRAKVLPIGSSRTDKPGLGAQVLDIGPRRQVGLGVEDAGHGGLGRVALARERVELGHDPIDVHPGTRGRHACFLHRVAVHVLVIEVRRGALAHRHEPLRAEGRHPDDVPFRTGYQSSPRR